MTLLRNYDACGMDVRFLYNPDEIFNQKQKKQQEDYLDSLLMKLHQLEIQFLIYLIY